LFGSRRSSFLGCRTFPLETAREEAGKVSNTDDGQKLARKTRATDPDVLERVSSVPMEVRMLEFPDLLQGRTSKAKMGWCDVRRENGCLRKEGTHAIAPSYSLPFGLKMMRKSGWRGKYCPVDGKRRGKARKGGREQTL
jgi:hypothetical protein